VAAHCDLEALLSVGRWIVALILLGAAVNVLLRFAPGEPRSERWLSAGSAFIVLSWAVMSVIFRVYVTSIASFKSAWGTFVTILILTAYLKISAIVFLVGAEADELIRKDASPGETGLFQRMRAAFG
jgi:membrane protein